MHRSTLNPQYPALQSRGLIANLARRDFQALWPTAKRKHLSRRDVIDRGGRHSSAAKATPRMLLENILLLIPLAFGFAHNIQM
jgi:hypothetical protein